MTSPADAKPALRARLRAELQAHSSVAAVAAAGGLCARLLASPAWRSARAVLLFAPLPREPDIAPLLADALASGKLLALPRWNAMTHAYDLVQVRDLGHELVTGQFGVREPAAHCPLVAMNRLDLALVPGLGFDVRGHRLGRGKGHYDRLLAGFTGMKLGVAFDFQVVATVPCEPHDIVLDAVVTPTWWIEAKAD